MIELFVSRDGGWSIIAIPRGGCAKMLGSGVAGFPIPKGIES